MARRTRSITRPISYKTIDIHQHDIANFMTCPFKYYMQSVLKYSKRKRNKNINIGDCVAKSVYWLHKGEPLEFCLAYIEKLQEEKTLLVTKQEEVDDLLTQGVLAQGLITGYNEMYLNRASHVVEILPEFHTKMEFIKMGYKIIITCRLDGLATDMWGGINILELKTTAQINKNMILSLPVDFQINTYWLSLLMGKVNPKGVLYRWMKKTGIRLKKKQTLEQYRQEILTLYSKEPENLFIQQAPEFKPEAIERFKPNFDKILEDLVWCHVQNKFVQKGVNCLGKFSPCSMLEYCSNPTSETLNTYYEVKQEQTEEKEDDDEAA
ncbi:MAG TPA: hypothetical protein DDX29_12100 [Clostridiales bacterium]|nr:hypothetical protein [Clostridiales bacterium]